MYQRMRMRLLAISERTLLIMAVGLFGLFVLVTVVAGDQIDQHLGRGAILALIAVIWMALTAVTEIIKKKPHSVAS